MNTSHSKMYAAFASAMEKKPSFDETITLLPRKASRISATSSMDRTFLTTGFGLRNIESLDQALREEERKQQLDMERRRRLLLGQESAQEEEYAGSAIYSDVMSQTESSLSAITSSSASRESAARKRVEYLMGIVGVSIEEEASLEEWEIPEYVKESQKERPKVTEAMRLAQRYLRTHKIFEFFQFLTAHLLSVLPENPIEFLTDMLSKCLIYRSGYGDPPLLYNREHIRELFNLMDPMRTGLINYNQYKSGINTLGVCSFNPDPPRNEDGLISKEYFVEETYERLKDQLNDMVRRYGVVVPPMTPPPSPDMQNQDIWTGASEQSFMSIQEKKL